MRYAQNLRGRGGPALKFGVGTTPLKGCAPAHQKVRPKNR